MNLVKMLSSGRACKNRFVRNVLAREKNPSQLVKLGVGQAFIQMSTRVTELPNDITAGMDRADIDRFMRMIRAVDAQMFVGWNGCESMLDSSCVHALRDAAASCEAVLANGGRVAMLGCGTSGRMCHLIELANRSTQIVSRISGGVASLAMYVPGFLDIEYNFLLL
jgi:N-acetylmuramic acid 6-phosphate (MurNAc-6-P) etherase